MTNASGTVQTFSAFIGNVNPIRYRGYYYDSETGFYYLQSRYYDPETGRFINADDPEIMSFSIDILLAKGLFTYCENNPVVNGDADGYGSWYERIYSDMSNSKFDDLIQKIDKEVNKKERGLKGLLLSAVKKMTGKIKFVGKAYAIVSTAWALFGRSEKEELNMIRYRWNELRHKYKTTKYKFRIYILNNFGTQTKVEVVNPNNKKVMYTLVVKFTYHGNGILPKLYKWLKELKIGYRTKKVSWKYHY